MHNKIASLFEAGMRQALEKRALEEKEKQTQTSQPPASPEQGDDTFDSLQQDTAPDDSATKDTQAMKGVPSFDDIVEKLNAVRAGRSLRDEEISATFKGYIAKLKPAEQTALFVFLKAIAQILSGEVAQPEVVKPESDPAKISIKKTQAQTRHVKPNVIKRPISGTKTTNEKPKPSKEDTSAPVPVQPQKRQ